MPHLPCMWSCVRLRGGLESGIIYRYFPAREDRTACTCLICRTRFFHVASTFARWSIVGPPGFPCLFFFLPPVIQFFDTARVDRTRSWLYAACSVSYLGAMVSSNSALQFVNYPTQVKPQDGMRVGSEVIWKGRRVFPSGLRLK